MALSESDYLALAQPELRRLLAAVDELGEEVDAELSSDILSVEFRDGTRFVINSHRAARQIWMAAGARAWHFDATTDGRWVAHKDNAELWSTLSEQLSSKLGRPLTLQPG